jgi:3D (Asp-Asp-Asp) domain-containing protein
MGLSAIALCAVCAVSGELYSAIADDGTFKTTKSQQADTKEESAATKQNTDQTTKSVTDQTKENSSSAKAASASGETETIEARDFHATAYCLKGRTASGAYVRKGIIAADPKVLPLGTVVHINAGKYTGTYTVADTGGRIRGKKVDIYVPTYKEAKNFGRQKVKIKVVNHPARSSKTKKASTAKGH